MTDSFTKLSLGNIVTIVGQEGSRKIYRIVDLDDQGRIILSPDSTVSLAADTDIDVSMRREIIEALTATIANGDSESAVVWPDGASMMVLLMPAAWTAADITFRVRRGGGDFVNLFDESGSEVVLTVAAGRAIPLPPEVMAAEAFLLRSGTAGTPVNQAADRTMTIQLKG